MKIVPDSSFYICFLDDINSPQYLMRILNCNLFDFLTGRKILKEISKSPKYQSIRDKIEKKVRIFDYATYGEILKPFISLEEILKGEDEIIAISYILNFLGSNFLVIIDEKDTREFFDRVFPEIKNRRTGTIGFLKKCCDYGIFSREETISILELIKNSKFRVKKEIIEDAISQLREESHG